MTSSPAVTVSTSGPVSATTPAWSLHCRDGNVAGQRSCSAPRRIIASPGLIAAAFTSTNTSPAAGTGFATSRTSRTSMPPYESYCTALLIRATTWRRARLFPECDPHTDFFGAHQVTQHLGEHCEFGVAVARQEILYAVPHLLVHPAVHLGDEAAVLGQGQRDLFAISRNRFAPDQIDVYEALDVLGHRAFQLTRP